MLSSSCGSRLPPEICLGEALDSVGLPRPGLAQATGWVGDGVEALVRKALTAAHQGRAPDDAEFRAALLAFDACYRERLFRSSRLYPQVHETLDALRAAGIAVGCVTNKRESYAHALLEAAGIDGALDFVYGGDTLPVKKPDPAALLAAARSFEVSPQHSVMVGDSSNDRAAARAAGFSFIFAAYGYARADDAELKDGLATIRSFAELRELLCPRGTAK